jgi:fructose-specific phosphotransferase system component IIB
MAQRIEIEIKGSDVKIEAIGFTGSACELETREVEQALGVVSERTKKPEYYQKTTQKQQVSSR